MKKPIFVRPLSDTEREALEAGLHSPDAFVLRRCQILLASNRGETSYRIARSLGCHDQTARNAIKRFNDGGIEEALEQGSRRPHTIHAAFSTEGARKLKEMLHQSPRDFGKPSSLWTLERAAEVSFEKGLTDCGAGQRRNYPGDARQARGALVAGQALDHQPRPRVRR